MDALTDRETQSGENTPSVTLGEHVARLIADYRLDQSPEDTTLASLAVDAMTDLVGVALAGSVEPCSLRLLASLSSDGHTGVGTAPIFALQKREISWSDAALFNGTAAHALDYDDGFYPAFAHLGATMVPALLVAGARFGLHGSDVLRGYLVGAEVGQILGERMNPTHYEQGWHATGTIGVMAAAAAVSSAMCLDVERAGHALAIAASSASGLRANFGTMVKPLHAGIAARGGYEAAVLASNSFVAGKSVIDDGYLPVFTARPLDDSSAIPSQIGRLRLLDGEASIGLKLYPSCYATHSPIDAALQLRPTFSDNWSEDLVVNIEVSDFVASVLRFSAPTNGMEAKFSLEYCVARALLSGAVTRQDFLGDGRLSDVPTQRCMAQMRVVTPSRFRQLEAGGSHLLEERDADDLRDPVHATRITLTTNEDILGSATSDLPPGKRGRWPSPEALERKFVDCVEAAALPGSPQEIHSVVRQLKDSTVREFWKRLSGEAA